MTLGFDSSQLRRHAWSIAVAMIVVASWGRGSLRALDETVFDPVAWAVSEIMPARQSEVVAISTVADYQDSNVDWRALLARLKSHGAMGVVVLYVPMSADGLAGADLPIVLGRPAHFERGAVEMAAWHLGPALDKQAAPRFELSPMGGTYDRVRVLGGSTPSMELRAARLVGGAKAASDDFVLPDFTRRVPMPRLDLHAVLEQGVPGDLLRGKLIALVRPEGYGELAIRVPGGWQSETSLRLRAIDSLIADRTTHELPWLAGALLLTAWAALMLWLFARTDALGSLYLALTLTAGLAIVESIAVAGLALRSPVVELWMLALIAWLGTRYAGFVDTQQEISERADQLGALVRTRILPDDLLVSDDYWSGIGRMVYQLLELERSIFLETVPGDHRVREVHAIACGIDDIEERRRDFEREPYRSAIARGSPVEVTGYLSSGEDETFLIALTFDNLVVGFWAFGLRPGTAAEDPQVLTLASAFAREIGELLYRRGIVEPEDDETHETLDVSGDQALLRNLASSVTLTGRRLETVEQVFMGLDSAVVMFDVYGRVLLANHRIEQLMERWGVALFDSSYVDLMARLTGLSLGEARERMRQTVVRRDPWQMVLTSPDDPDERWLLHVHPIVDHIETQERDAEPGNEHPFGVACVAFELIDWAEAGSAEGYRRPLVARLQERLAKLTETDSASLGKVRHALDVAARYLFFSDGPRARRVPMPLRECCEGVVARLSEEIEQRRIRVEISGSEHGDFALIEPGALQRILRAVLLFVVGDARPGTTVRVTVADRGAELDIANDGVGLPATQLAAILDLDQVGAHDDDQMREALRELRAAGGDAEFESEVGIGTRCRLCFDALVV